MGRDCVIEDPDGAALFPLSGPFRALKDTEEAFMRTILRVALLLILFTAAAALPS